MDKKIIQEQRMREYFIQATKELLKSEGLRAVNVRAVSERAGYSYATLYNYFKDLNELIFECVKDFQKECEEFVISETEKMTDGRKKIQAIIMSYISYFVQYPGIFELFFTEQMRSLGNQSNIAELIYSFTDHLCEEQWHYCKKQSVFTPTQIKVARDQLRFVSAGLLLYYLNRRHPEDYKDFMTLAETQVKRALTV